MNETNIKPYDWIPFYREISQKLVEIGDKDQPERDLAIEEMARKIFKDDAPILRFKPIDPLSFIYVLASRNGTTKSRQYFEYVKRQLDLKADAPTDGIYPTPPALAGLFMAAGGKRTQSENPTKQEKLDAVNHLWSIFTTTAMSENHKKLSNEAFFNCLQCPGVGVAKLSQSMFLINPDCYLPLDREGSLGLLLSPYPEPGKEVRKEANKIIKRIRKREYNLHDVLEDIHKKLPGWKPYEINFFSYISGLDKEKKKMYVNTPESQSKLDSIEKLKKRKIIPPSDNGSLPEKDPSSNKPLNRIFYGPPGTGKTYRTIKAALEIVDPDSAKGDRSHLLERFDELRKEGKVEFVTFHQSFGYEEFIEGIRPVIGEGEDGEVTYEIKDGIFKSACLRATRTKSSTQFDEAIEELKQRCSEEPVEMETSRGNKIEVGYPGLTTFRVKTSDSSRRHPVNVEHVKKMYQGADSQNFYNLSYIRSIISHIKKHYDIGEETVTHVPGRYVLIIDEINRGNISRIFGELITLIEDSKRLGNDEATKTTLPYSGDSFGVPNNLYIIGTMNTADRSIALLDTALRRRFRFEEMMPDVGLVKKITIEGINVGEMLEAINRRIEWLYDRDHQIGHSFFLRLKDDPTIKALNDIFRYEILPLLQEYFYDDWSKINQILNKNGFLESDKPPKGLLDSDALDSDKRLWKINREPFTPEQYLKIYQGHITDGKGDSSP